MNLSPDVKLQFERRARQTRDKSEYTRLCIILARSEGMSPESIARAHRISVSNVYQYLSDYDKENKTQHESRGGNSVVVIYATTPKFDTKKTFSLVLKDELCYKVF